MFLIIYSVFYVMALRYFHLFTLLTLFKMGNTESVSVHNDRPGSLMDEAARNLSMGFSEPAIAKYRKAYELYKENGEISCSARALRNAAEIGLNVDLELASKAFEEVANLYTSCDVTISGSYANYSNSIYCLLACGRAATAKEKIEYFAKACTKYENSDEGIACKSILESFRGGNRCATKDKIEGFKDVFNLPAWRQKLLQKVLDRLS
jgi:tetratricopeptide (TPR) repeat protein